MSQPFIPNAPDAFDVSQARPASADWDVLIAAHDVTGVVSGCAVTEDPSTPDMTVDVAAGVVRISGETVTVTAQANNTIATADGTYPRLDLISVNSSGTVVVSTGTPATIPTYPAIPADSVALAAVAVPISDTAITDAQIVDKRQTIPEATVFNVKDYGATGDGVTDDSTAIEAALTAAGAAGGGIVFFPAGTFITGAVLTPDSNTIMRGVGPNSVVKQDSGAGNFAVVSIASKTKTVVQDLVFDANNESGTVAVVIYTGGSEHLVERCEVKNQTGATTGGIVVTSGVTDVTIRGCEFHDTQRGVYGNNNVYRISVLDSDFHDLDDAGTYFIGSSTTVVEDLHVIGNRFRDIIGGSPRQPIYASAPDGYYIDRPIVADNIVIGNGTHFNSGTGNGDLIAVYNFRDGVVSGNRINLGGDVGISVADALRTTITGNTVDQCNTNGIVVYDSSDCSVVGNIVTNCRQDWGTELSGAYGGIRVMYADSDPTENNTVVGNVCTDDQGVKTQDYGIVIESGADFTKVAGNALQGNDTGPYLDESTTTIWEDGGTFNVKDYGATGDGATDDTAAIQAALTAGAAATVFFPPAVYRCDDLTASADTTIIMHGAELERHAISGSAILSLGARCRVEGGEFDGRDLSVGGAKADAGLKVGGVDCIVNGVTSHDNYADGIRVDTADRSRINDCTAYDNGTNPGASGTGDGFYVLNSDDVWLTNCDARNNARTGLVATTDNAGLDVTLSYRVRFNSCRAEGSGYVDVNMEGVSDPVINDLWCDGSVTSSSSVGGQFSGITIEDGGFGATSHDHLHLSHIDIQKDDSNSALFVSGLRPRITDVKILGTGASQTSNAFEVRDATDELGTIHNVHVDDCNNAIVMEGIVTASGFDVQNVANDRIRVIRASGASAKPADLESITDHRMRGQAAAAPTAGYWIQGDILYDSTPSAAGTMGWVCTATGSAGTWKTFGTIEGVFNVKDYGATGNGTTDDQSAIQAAVTAAIAADGHVFFPPGTYRVASTVNVTSFTDGKISGSGQGSIIKADATVTAFQFTSCARITVRDFQVEDGAVAFDVDGATDSFFENLHLLDQTSNGVLIDGDDSTEQHWTDIIIRDCDDTGFKYTRTDAVDTGGMYLTRVRSVGVGGTTNAGFEFSSTHTSVTPAFINMTDCVADNCDVDGCIFDNIAHTEINGCFFTANSTSPSGSAGLHISDGYIHKITNSYLGNGRTTTDAYCLLIDTSAHEVIIDNVILDGNATNGTGIGWSGAGSSSTLYLGQFHCYAGTIHDDDDNYVDAVSRTGLLAYSDTSRPSAAGVRAGTMIWNTDDGFPNWSDGTNWVTATGATT